MDIQGSAASADVAGLEPGRTGSFESVAAERREVEEFTEVRAERSSTDEGVGNLVDIEA